MIWTQRLAAPRLPAIIAALAIVQFLASPSVARAEEPFRLDGRITDRVAALEGREGEVEAALQQLEQDDDVELWVVYVATFSGRNAQDWADETANISSLGLNDALLAVATEDRAYAYSVDQQFPLTDAELARIATGAIEPALSNDDWAGAAIAAAEGIGQALDGRPAPGEDVQPEAPDDGGASWLAWVLVGLVVLGLIVFVVYRLRRAGGRKGVPVPAPPPTADPYDRMSLDELRRRAAAQLVETDDAIRTSEQELAFAIAEFGEEQTAPFAAALEAAREDMAVAFRVQQRLDDSEPEDDATRRSMLIEICHRTDAASDRLDAEAQKFDELRDLQKKVPEILPRLEREIVALSDRIPMVSTTVAELRRVYAPTAIAAVADNDEQARQRLAFASEQVTAGRAHLDAGNAGRAAVAARAAEEAVGQAARLLDAVDRLGRDLAGSANKIQAAIADMESSLTEARRIGEGKELGALMGRAEVALMEARTAASDEGGRDPLGALERLEEADDALDRALEGIRDERARKQKARASLDQALLAARARIDAATDFITTRRGAVRSEARTRLSEAGRHYDRAVSLAESDPATGLRHARSAESLAHDAQRLADDDVSRYGRPPGGFGGGGSDWGAILGGILIGNVLGGGGGRAGGWRTPGRSGGGRRGGGGGFGGFGGGRRGGGGRFRVGSFGGRGMGGRRGGGGRF